MQLCLATLPNILIRARAPEIWEWIQLTWPFNNSNSSNCPWIYKARPRTQKTTCYNWALLLEINSVRPERSLPWVNLIRVSKTRKAMGEVKTSRRRRMDCQFRLTKSSILCTWPALCFTNASKSICPLIVSTLRRCLVLNTVHPYQSTSGQKKIVISLLTRWWPPSVMSPTSET